MKIKILSAAMTYSASGGYKGQVAFEAEGHKRPYEMTLQSDGSLDDWNYALHFLDEPGPEEEIDQVEQAVETDDELFDDLLEAAVGALPDTLS